VANRSTTEIRHKLPFESEAFAEILHTASEFSRASAQAADVFTNRSLSDTRCQLRSQLSCTSVACQMSTCEINRQLVLVPKLAVVCRSADKYTNVKIYQHFNHTTHLFTTPPAKWACPRGVSVSVSARYWPAQVARCSPNIVTHVKGCDICTSGFP